MSGSVAIVIIWFLFIKHAQSVFASVNITVTFHGHKSLMLGRPDPLPFTERVWLHQTTVLQCMHACMKC